MHRLESEELESYVSRLLEVQNSIYDVVEFESKVEYEFAKALDARTDIKLFFKLPDWFKVETPLAPTIQIGQSSARNRTARTRCTWCVKPKARRPGSKCPKSSGRKFSAARHISKPLDSRKGSTIGWPQRRECKGTPKCWVMQKAIFGGGTRFEMYLGRSCSPRFSCD